METLKAIALRRSTRSFKAEPVPEDVLNLILEAGSVAPVGMGAHETLRLTAVQDAALLQRISRAGAQAVGRPGTDLLYGASVLIIVSSRQGDMPSIAAANGACAVENMLLAATDLGLGSVYILGMLQAFQTDPELLRALQLPEGYAPVASAAIGYATEPLDQERQRSKTIAIARI
jgi:nitroreductase